MRSTELIIAEMYNLVYPDMNKCDKLKDLINELIAAHSEMIKEIRRKLIDKTVEELERNFL